MDGPTNEKPPGLQLFFGVGIGIVLAAAVATALTVARGRANAHAAGSASGSAHAASAPHAADIASLPTIAIDNPETVTSIEITRAKEAPIKLEKRQGAWRLVAPIEAKADDAGVQGFLGATKSWGLGSAITPAADADKAFATERAHIVILRGTETPVDLTVGGEENVTPKLRVAGRPDTYEAVAFPKGLLAKDATDWRDRSVLKVDGESVERILIENPHGTFELTRAGTTWKASRSAASDEFNPARVDDLLHAMKAIEALGFADANADTGLDKPTLFGGQIKLFIKGSTDPIQITFGKTTKGGRFASVSGNSDVFVVSGWVADWATADATKFTHK